jgi:hypothetical protein
MTDRILILGTPCYAYHCITCGVAFVVPAVVADKHYEQGGFHHCPNGHSQGWPKEGSENAQLRRERDRLRQQAARLEQERDEAEAKLRRMRGRAAAGMCPCCKRSFANMARHMKTKHPDYRPATNA